MRASIGIMCAVIVALGVVIVKVNNSFMGMFDSIFPKLTTYNRQ